MSKKSREIEKQKQRISKAEKEKRLNIVNSCCKCTICGAWIKYPSRKRHLRTEHNLFPEDIKSYFLNRKAARAEEREERIAKVIREEFERTSEKTDDGFYKCGEKVAGGPFVRIIYNAVGTNRRKH
ncbi:hypothetical protein [Duncaniella muris]|jgi:hypothetical protein|uniref:hypothetical protein n=1 Tax=Duncaniella muris TaxID=2094150 RepID=UPI00259C7726|nr:hypothetical protein [Duncaniella muris]MCX4335260.1 hypothetical protein [Bacteroidales bacterium]